MLRAIVLALLAVIGSANPAWAQGSLRFFGHGVDDIDRVKIRIDDPASPSDPGPPVDVGATDFTIEFFMKATAAENPAPAINCTSYEWIQGNIVLDRDRFNQGRGFGLSIAGGLVAFGLNNENQSAETLCSSVGVLGEDWHHVAVQRRRSDGHLWLHVDGNLEAQVDGPDGDVSYPDDGVPMNFCGPTGTDPCVNSDPFVVLGAEKHDAGSQFPSYSGWLDELRFSSSLRYGGASFAPPTQPFSPDAETVALYHFDDATSVDCTGTVPDVSGASGGPSDGLCSFGGTLPAGPVYSSLTLFATQPVPALGVAGRGLLALVLLVGAGGWKLVQLVRRR